MNNRSPCIRCYSRGVMVMRRQGRVCAACMFPKPSDSKPSWNRGEIRGRALARKLRLRKT